MRCQLDYAAHLKGLRKNYIEATLSQRLHVASQRIKGSGDGPDLLVAYVSAIEGFARSLAMHQVASTKEQLWSVYPEFQYTGAKELISLYLRNKRGCDPEAFFGKEPWAKLGFAIEYRNLLAHECTYLKQDKFSDILAVCHGVLTKLAEAEGMQFEAT